MENEIVKLQQRVAELESALAGISQKRPSRHGGRIALITIFCSTIVAIGFVVASATGAATTVTEQGPSTVTAPFTVVDNRGRTLFRLQMSASGAGLAVFYDDAGEEVAIIGHATGSNQPTIRIMDKGIDKVGIGTSKGDGLIQVGNDVQSRVQLVGGEDASVSVMNAAGQQAARVFKTKSGSGAMDINTSGKTRVELGISGAGDAGLIKLYSNTTQAQTILHGDAGLQQRNASGQPVLQLGVDDNGQGYARTANRAGTYVSKISVASDGSGGRVEVSQGGDVKVLMGVLENGKGDVCANGDPGKQVCMSGLAVKSLIRY